MRRSLKYIAFAGTSIFSCALMYKTYGDPKFGTLHAAANRTNAEVLRSGPAYPIQEWDTNWDFREPKYWTKPGSPDVPSLKEHFGEVCEEKASSHKPSATRHLVFIRHGQYVKGQEDKDRILTHCGKQQAEETAKRLKLLHSNNKKIDKIVISTMTRAKETGEFIRKALPDVPYEYCEFLREGAPCTPEPPYNCRTIPKEHRVFQESARIEAAFRKYFYRADPEQNTDSIEVYVCHANVIRYFVCRALQFPSEGWLRMRTNNCGITWLTIRPNGRVQLRSMGDTGHLPPNLITHD